MFTFKLNAAKLELEKEIILLQSKRDSEKTKLALDKEIRELKDELSGLKTQQREENKRLSLDRKMADEDIRHMVKMKEERLNIEYEKKIHACEKEKDLVIAKVKDSYRDKIEGRFIEEAKNMEKIHGEILKRLPNVNVKLYGGTNGE